MKKLLLLAPIGVVAAVIGVIVAYTGATGGSQGSANVGGGTACAPGIDPVSLAAAHGSAGLTKEQVANAAVVIAVGKKQSVPPRGWLIALAAASQESHFRNLANPTVPASLLLPHQGLGSDHDSVGLFQQRGSWGTAAQRLNPTYAATQFYARLVTVPGWQSMPVTVAAQTVQVSAFPDAYADDAALAASLVTTLADVEASDLAGCSVADELPLSGKGATIVAAARRYLGLPYVFDAGDARGPTKALGGCDAAAIGGCNAVGFDCSGLSLFAWAQVGITLDHYAATQYRQGRQVPVARAQPGDLLFWATATSDEASIHHVAVYLGNDRMIEAPQSGETVHETAVRHDNELMPMAVEPVASR